MPYRDARVGIVITQACQQRNFQIFHGGSFASIVMVVTEQVQNAMYGEMSRMCGKTFALGCSFPAQNAIAEHNIAKPWRKHRRCRE